MFPSCRWGTRNRGLRCGKHQCSILTTFQFHAPLSRQGGICGKNAGLCVVLDTANTSAVQYFEKLNRESEGGGARTPVQAACECVNHLLLSQPKIRGTTTLLIWNTCRALIITLYTHPVVSSYASPRMSLLYTYVGVRSHGDCANKSSSCHESGVDVGAATR